MVIRDMRDVARNGLPRSYMCKEHATLAAQHGHATHLRAWTCASALSAARRRSSRALSIASSSLRRSCASPSHTLCCPTWLSSPRHRARAASLSSVAWANCGKAPWVRVRVVSPAIEWDVSHQP